MRRFIRRPSHATIVAYLALFVAMSGTAAAATGGTAILGRWNSSSKATGFSNPSGPALRLAAGPGHSPLTVASARRVTNLNSDRLDGYDASDFLPSLGKAVDADRLDGQDASAFQKGLGGTYVLTTSFCPSGTLADSTITVNYSYSSLEKTMTLCRIF